MILESILEKSGLVKNREYFVQQSFAKEDSEKEGFNLILLSLCPVTGM